MKITIVAVGKIKEKYLAAGIAEYAKRLSPYCRLNIVEVDEERMPDSPSAAEKEKVLEKEGVRVLRHIPATSHLIVLDVAGEQSSSEELAAKLAELALAGQSDITFAIGGAFGLSRSLLQAAHERLSFSKMTFTHQMIRMMLVEQVYRAFKINRGEPYHW
jgi:23S rRNA (pseudouridine1915-N3)-methyltransferase